MTEPRGRPRLGARRISSLMSATLVVALVVSALLRFSSVAVRPDGALAGAMLLMIGVTVGSIIGSQPVPRLVTIVATLLFFICMVNGLIKNVGSPLTKWAFVCMSIGLLIGAFHFELRSHEENKGP